jgi:hypothetical protein
VDSDSLKALANRLARLAATPDGARMAHLFRINSQLALGADEPTDRPIARDRHTDTAQPRVGVWQQASGGQDFVRRSEQQEEWHFWANVGRIPRKRARWRVVLVGESVARGYFYDPQFNVCGALQVLLKSVLGADAVEVVDLARTSIGVEVAQLAHDALALKPDALVMFAGNNWWWAAGVDNDSFVSRAEVLRASGIKGLKELVEKQHAEGVKALVRSVSQVYRDRNVPVIWIVPEFNLGDWRDPLRPAPLFVNEDHHVWLESWTTAQYMLEAGDYTAARSWAGKMVELDGGTSPAGLYILGDCRLLMGDSAGARNCFKLARDATIWETALRLPKSPRAYTATQEALRAEAAACGDQLVDLPEVFSRHIDDGLPDRRAFLDYCHLSARGMQTAVAAIGSCVVRVIASKELIWSSAVAETPLPSDSVQAEALFLAAIHNAHHSNQRPGLIAHYCREALKLQPRIADVMKAFVELQTRSTPVLLSASAEALAELPARSIRHYLLRENSHQFDRQLLDTMVSALAGAGSADGAADLLSRIRIEEHSAARRSVNLLEYYYSSATCPLDETYWTYAERARRAYFRAYSPATRFIFVGEAGRPLVLRVACRTPHVAGGRIHVDINGAAAASVTICSDWQALELELGADAVLNGVNEIAIHWPSPESRAVKAVEVEAEKWLQGEVPELYCVFGEIHSLTVSPRDGPDQRHDNRR